MEAGINGQVSALIVVGSLVVKAVPPEFVRVSNTSRFDRHDGALLQLTSLTQSGVTWTFTVRVPTDASTLKKSTSAAELTIPRSVVPLFKAVAVAAVLP